MKKLLTKQTRKYVYSATIAVLAFGVIMGWWGAEIAIAVPPLIMALLNLSPDEVPPAE